MTQRQLEHQDHTQQTAHHHPHPDARPQLLHERRYCLWDRGL